MHDDIYARHLDGLRTVGQHRSLRRVSPVIREGQAGRILLNGRETLNFASNDYLGLSAHPELIRRAGEFATRWGAGSTASRLVCGSLPPFHDLEARIAAWKGREAALIFNSGYQANASVIAALLDPKVLGRAPLVFADRLNHASMHDGCASAGIRQIRYRHLDLNHLEDRLRVHIKADPDTPRFILSESVFSMDGDSADVAGLAELARRYEAFLYIDEAHAGGVLGPDGAGLAHGLIDVDLVMGTCSKGLGCFGAYVACSAVLADYLVNRARGFIFSTALPPAVLGSIDAALDLLPGLETERTRVLGHGDRLRTACRDLGLECGLSDTQIVPVILGEESTALTAGRALEEAGALVGVIRPPTVPPGTSRLRISLSAAHTDEDVARLIKTLGRVLDKVSP